MIFDWFLREQWLKLCLNLHFVALSANMYNTQGRIISGRRGKGEVCARSAWNFFWSPLRSPPPKDLGVEGKFFYTFLQGYTYILAFPSPPPGVGRLLQKNLEYLYPKGFELQQMKFPGAKMFTLRYFKNLCNPKNRKNAIFQDFVLSQLWNAIAPQPIVVEHF